MASLRTLEAQTAADLSAILRVVRKQEFNESDVLFDARGGYVAIPFHVKFGPDAGGWTLLIRTATDWKIRHRGEHDIEVFETIEFDAARSVVVVKCLMDHMEAKVARLDVRLTLAAAGDDAEKTYEDLPLMFRKDVEELKQRRFEGIVVREAARRRLQWHGAAASALFSMVLSVFAGGSALAIFLLAPLIAGSVGFLCVRSGIGPRSASPFYGLAGAAVMAGSVAGAGGFGGVMGGALVFLCGTLLHIVAGTAILIWLREERSVRS